MRRIHIFLNLFLLSLVCSSYTYKITRLPQSGSLFVFNKPTTFGKTHFIIDYQPNKDKCTPWVGKKNNRLQEQKTPKICEVFFSPDDNINGELLSLIDQEKKHIRIAVFSFTDRTIAQALIRAKKRGVVVEVITDVHCAYDRYSKISQLYDNEILVFIYNQKQSKVAKSIMHHKFALFAHNKTKKGLIWTGSCNFTRAGSHTNQENAILLDDQKVIERFLRQFEHIKKQSYQYPLLR